MTAVRSWWWGWTVGLAATAWAQWNPAQGLWGKTAPTDIRVMTWNIEDGICSTASKQEQDNYDWCALAHIVAALRPDILLLQEAGDNSGHGTGSGVDSQSVLLHTIDLFLHGGTDIYSPGQPPVTAFVQQYAPDYDLPYVWVSVETDNYNRNVILSRFPFRDLNGDTRSVYSDIPTVFADLYAPGGDGGIRGFQLAEIDLDDAVYCGDLVVGNGHLHASDANARLVAAQNIAYVLDYWYNGADAGYPDPRNRIYDNPPATAILDEFTPIVAGGDLNEDELTNGRRGPADWITQAATSGGNDGTDRDRSDMTYDDARHPYNNSRNTTSSAKRDYLCWQDSIAALRLAFNFHTAYMPVSWLPPEVLSYASPSQASTHASDHRPVVIDLALPMIASGDCGGPCAGFTLGDANADGIVNAFDIDAFVLALTNPSGYIAQYGQQAYLCQCDISGDGAVNAFDIDPFVQLLTGG